MPPPPPVHTLSLTATAADMDELGHVSNLVYLRWVLAAATSHSAAAGWDLARYRSAGFVFVVRRHEIDYLVPAAAGDAIAAETWIEEWRGPTSVRATRIVRDRTELARALTTWVLVETAGGRPRRIPAEVHEAFGAPIERGGLRGRRS